MSSKPPFVPMSSQSPSIPAAGQPPSTSIATQTIPLMPIPGQSHPRGNGQPHPQSSIPPQRQRGSCTPIASLKIPEEPCIIKKVVTLYTLSLPLEHYKMSVDIGQSHMEGSPLPVHIEDENRMTLRDAIEKGIMPHKGVHHFTNEGLVHRIIPEEFANVEGITTFNNLRIMVSGDKTVQVVENTYSKIGKDEIKEVICHRVLSASSLCFILVICVMPTCMTLTRQAEGLTFAILETSFAYGCVNVSN
ncbi:putative peroxisome proliferator-activated receptor gamma coactivator-related [Sesbania bispinosa]|nr:putative peroxisome proliferator-activated receptor gamma coactivator-related [Sesbania bispinosa]